MERLTITKMFIIGIAIKWNSVASKDIGFIPTNDREIEVMNQVNDMHSMGNLLNRDMHKWWDEYDEMMADYKSKWNASICTDPKMLSVLLANAKNKVEKVRFGWNQKIEQLGKIREILHHEDYKNITGLLYTAFNDYLIEQDGQANEEDKLLKAEEAQVIKEGAVLNTHPCPCIWGQWEGWGECTMSCGGGSKTRLRAVLQNATNGGDECEGSNSEMTSCNPDPCPIDCMWGTWGEWSDCSTLCGDGISERFRVHAILAQFGGKNCTGNPRDTMACNVLKRTRELVQHQQAEIQDLKAQLAECIKVCPDEIGWISAGDSCYRISTTAMNWHEAKLFCSNTMNGHMVEVTSAEETNILKKIVANNNGPNSHDPMYWLGLQDLAVHGQWVWDNSATKISSATYTNWQASQPDFLDKEHCSVLCHGGQWCDYHCHMKKADGRYNILALCEAPKRCL